MRALFVALLLALLAVPIWAQYDNPRTIYDPSTGSFQYLYQFRDGSGYVYNRDKGSYQYLVSTRPQQDAQWGIQGMNDDYFDYSR